jgi:hypothetical protein
MFFRRAFEASSLLEERSRGAVFAQATLENPISFSVVLLRVSVPPWWGFAPSDPGDPEFYFLVNIPSLPYPLPMYPTDPRLA